MILAVRRMARRPIRAAVTISLVGLGLTTYVLIRTAAVALVERYQAVVAASEAEIVVQQAGIGLALLSRISRDDARRLVEVEGVSAASGVVVQITRMSDGTRVFVTGLDDGTPVARVFHIVEGRAPARGSGELMLGRAVAARLRVAPGDNVTILGSRLRLAGVFDSGIGFLDQWAVVETTTAQALFQLGPVVNLVFVDLARGADADGVIAEITRRMPHLQATVSELYLATFQERVMLERFALLLALIGLAAGALAASLATGAAVHERADELAVLRALGWDRRRIAGTVVGGTLAETAAGTGLGLILALLCLHVADTGPLAGVLPVTPTLAVVAEGSVAMLVASLIGSLPALARAVRLQPAAILRTG